MIFKKIRQIIYVDGFNFLFHKKNKNMILEESFKSCIFMSIQLGQKKHSTRNHLKINRKR